MKTRTIYGAMAAVTFGLSAVPASAQTQWIQDTLSDQCSAASQTAIADRTRQSIEEQVRRAEAAIQEPASIGDLSCMNDLLGADMDIFSKSWGGLNGFNIEGIINDIAGGLKSGMSIQSLSGGVERAICEFAAEHFSELTSGVTSGLDDLLDPASVLDQMPDYMDGFSNVNIPLSESTGSSAQDGDPDTGTATPSSSGNGSGTSTSYSPVTGDGSGSQDDDTAANIQSIWNSMSGGN